MVEIVVEHLWRERAMNKRLQTERVKTAYLLGRKLQGGEDVRRIGIVRNAAVVSGETQNRGGPRKVARNIETRRLLDRAQ
jgi:hypothetical protein